MDDRTHPDPELEQLRLAHPLWRIEITWTSSASGADVRTFHATDGVVVIVAYSAASLAAQIGQAKRGL